MQNLENVTFFVILVYLCSKYKSLYFIPHRTWCNESYKVVGDAEAVRQSRAKLKRHFAKKGIFEVNPPPPQSNVEIYVTNELTMPATHFLLGLGNTAFGGRGVYLKNSLFCKVSHQFCTGLSECLSNTCSLLTFITPCAMRDEVQTFVLLKQVYLNYEKCEIL